MTRNKNLDKKSLLKLKEKLKEKLEHAINNSQETFYDFIDHDYCQSDITDCIVYYITGYLCNYILKSIKCEICQNAFVNPVTCSPFPAVALIHLKNDKDLIHPNVKMFNFIKYLETLFSKYCHRADVFDVIIENIYVKNLSYPCKEHSDIVLAQIIEFYILLRMRQYSNQLNNQKKKLNQNVKKSAKFYNH